MKRKGWVAALGVLGLFLLSVLVLRLYRLELVHHVVVNALIQKAPQGFPQDRIRHAFDAARDTSRRQSGEQRYLDYLLALSQQLEKVQHLSAQEVEAILEEVNRMESSRGQGLRRLNGGFDQSLSLLPRDGIFFPRQVSQPAERAGVYANIAP